MTFLTQSNTKSYPWYHQGYFKTFTSLFLVICMLLQPLFPAYAADQPVKQLTYETVGYIKGCGTMQGGASDGQYLYYICATDGASRLRIVKVTPDGKIVNQSNKFTRGQLGHGNDIAYNNKLNLLVVSVWDEPDGGSKVKFIDPNTYEIKKTMSTNDDSSTSRLCYNAATSQYVIGGKVYDEDFKYTGKRVFTPASVDEDTDTKKSGKVLNQGIECDASYIYVLRSVIGQNGYNIITVYDWSGENAGVYRLGLNDEGENLSLVNGTMYMGVNESGASSGGNSNNDYFVRINGLGTGTINNCGGIPLDEATLNQYEDWAIGKYGYEEICCNIIDSGGGLVGSNNAEKAFNFLTNTAIKTNNNKPMSEAQAAGVVGNLMRETGGDTYELKPDAVNSIGAHGIVQWLGTRWTSSNGNGLKEFAADKGKDWTDLRTQLEFIIFELEKNETAVIKDSAFMNAANSPEGATTAAARWAKLYERPGPPPYAQREANARKAFNDFGGGASQDTTQDTAQSPTAYLTQAVETECTSSAGGYVFPLQASKADIRTWGNDPGTDEWKSGRYHEHTFPGYWAVDIMAPEGTPVVAFHSGTVIHIREGDSYGALSIQIKDDNGYTYYYQHLSLSRKAQVKVDQKVEAGTLIGYIGNKREGWNTVPHLHIDKSKNPGNGLRGTCTASRNYCPIASENRFAKIVKELHDSFEKLPDTAANGM